MQCGDEREQRLIDKINWNFFETSIAIEYFLSFDKFWLLRENLFRVVQIFKHWTNQSRKKKFFVLSVTGNSFVKLIRILGETKNVAIYFN